MANKQLFSFTSSFNLPKTNAVNEAGGRAYKLSPKAMLAQYVATGCFGDTYYASAGEQLETVLKLTSQVEPEFIAKLAIYGRRKAHMKDTPALLLASLSVLSPGLMAEAFDRVIDNGRMLRNFVQIMRSGVVARKSLGSLPKRMVQQWLDQRPAEKLFFDSVGNDPSIADVIKMVHPKPGSDERAALYAYRIGKAHDVEKLPPIVRDFEQFKQRLLGDQAKHVKAKEVPDVPFQMLTGLPLRPSHWKAIAETAPWQMTRMNLNTFARHDVLKDKSMVKQIAKRLADPAAIKRSRVFPYQLMVAHASAGKAMPNEISEALHDAMEIAVDNVPSFGGPGGGKVFVLPDVSGSMHSAVNGYRRGATTAVRCIDVAALVAAAVLRKNRGAEVIPFHDKVQPCKLTGRDSVLTNAQKLAALPSGGTRCSAPLRHLNERKETADLVIFVSDNESWIDGNRRWSYGDPTETLKEWTNFKKRSPRAKLVCIDIQPYGTTQAQTREDILNVGGFGDSVFEVIARFAAGELGDDHWVKVIEEVTL